MFFFEYGYYYYAFDTPGWVVGGSRSNSVFLFWGVSVKYSRLTGCHPVWKAVI